MAALQLLCSTGALVGRSNGYDHRVILENKNAIEADGFELMMLSAWYDRLPEVARDLEKGQVYTPVIHLEKDVSPLLFLGDEASAREGLRLFTQNVRMGAAVGAKKAVFHLWDGRFTRERLDRGLATVETLYEICAEEGISLLIENIPCRVCSPYLLIEGLSERFPTERFTFDVRHAAFMGESERFFRSPLFGRAIGHLHFSDYTGQMLPDKWGVTRPIVQPTEGIIDFDRLFAEMPPFSGETMTLESPALGVDGTVDREKLNRSLRFLSKNMKK